MAISKDGKSGGWRYPRTEGERIWTNQILHSVVTATCCEGNTCGDTGCQCKDIIDEESFKKCVCADEWTKFDGRCYRYSGDNTKVLFDAAEAQCKEWWPTAHLASVNSQKELEFVREYDKALWLGGTDRGSEGEWYWLDGSQWFEDWATDKRQPDNLMDFQHCVQGNSYRNTLGWDDENCDKKHNPFLCKY